MTCLRFKLAAMLCVIMAVLAGSPGCSSDTEPSCRPEVPAGRIHGQVVTGGAAIDAVVSATRIPDDSQALAILEVEPDSSGFYTLDVPAGRYLVSLRAGGYRTVYVYSAAGLRFGDDAVGDTLLIDGSTSPLTIDFLLSSVHVHMDLPGGTDSLSATVQLHRRGVPPSSSWRTYVDRALTTVRNGATDATIAGLLPGSYRVEVIIGRLEFLCDCLWDGEHVWVPGTRDSTSSPWIEVPVNHLVEVTGRIDTEPARIEGEIGGAWRELGLAPPAVALVTPESLVVRGFREVGGDGRFAVTMYLAGPVKLCVEHDRVQRWIGGETFETAQVFMLENGRTISDVRLDESVLLVEFTQPDMWPGQPSMYVYDQRDLSLAAVIETPSSTGSIFVIPNLRPGTYLLRIEPMLPGYGSWISQWYDRASRPEDAQPISIGSDGSIVRVAVVLERGGRIQGLVSGGEEDREFLFYLTSAGDRTRWVLGYGGLSGREFDLKSIPDGEWKVGAWPARPNEYPEQAPPGTIWYPGTTDWSAAGVISIRDAGEVTGLAIVVPAR